VFNCNGTEYLIQDLQLKFELQALGLSTKIESTTAEEWDEAEKYAVNKS